MDQKWPPGHRGGFDLTRRAMGVHGAALNGEATWSAFIKSSLGLFHEAQVIAVVQSLSCV